MANHSLLARVKAAACDATYVSMGSRRTTSVHEFYRYPARFSPELARSVIEALTSPGDFVLDPFVGGGTTLVESRLLGRIAVGADISSLAVFVSRAKTAFTPYAARETLLDFASRVEAIRLDASVELPQDHLHLGYLRHLDRPDTWRVRNLIAQLLREVDALPRGRLLARCALLRTAQWALDMRSVVPTVAEFRESLAASTRQMAEVAHGYTASVRRVDKRVPTRLRRTLALRAASPGLASDPRLSRYPIPRLVMTSPPYPGVYVNYHRWKLLGRHETPAPFWIAGRLDGNGLSYYTMGARADHTLSTYFTRLEAAWRDIVRVADAKTWFIQVVGFNQPQVQLHRYLEVMRRCGLREIRLPELGTAPDGRLWRTVPSRRWWMVAGNRGSVAPSTSEEVILLHRLSS